MRRVAVGWRLARTGPPGCASRIPSGGSSGGSGRSRRASPALQAKLHARMGWKWLKSARGKEKDVGYSRDTESTEKVCFFVGLHKTHKTVSLAQIPPDGAGNGREAS